jgi:hypothetical protein
MLIGSIGVNLQTAALHAIMELVRNEVQGEFNNRLYMKLCSTLVSIALP